MEKPYLFFLVFAIIAILAMLAVGALTMFSGSKKRKKTKKVVIMPTGYYYPGNHNHYCSTAPTTPTPPVNQTVVGNPNAGFCQHCHRPINGAGWQVSRGLVCPGNCQKPDPQTSLSLSIGTINGVPMPAPAPAAFSPAVAEKPKKEKTDKRAKDELPTLPFKKAEPKSFNVGTGDEEALMPLCQRCGKNRVNESWQKHCQACFTPRRQQRDEEDNFVSAKREADRKVEEAAIKKITAPAIAPTKAKVDDSVDKLFA